MKTRGKDENSPKILYLTVYRYVYGTRICPDTKTNVHNTKHNYLALQSLDLPLV